MRLLGLFAAALGQWTHVASALSGPLGDLELFAMPLPAHVGVGEDVPGLELRLYLPVDETSVVRVTPTCAGITFSPTFVLFDAVTSLASDIVVETTATGGWTVEYIATLENDDLNQGEAVLFSQAVNVLATPVAYDVDDVGWDGVIIQSDSFDEPLDELADPSVPTSAFWSLQQHGYSSNACGAFDGDTALYFSSLGERQALTAPLELLGFHGKMHFYHIYGFQAVQGYDLQGDNRVACEKADAGEEVVFAYLPVEADALNVSSWQPIFQVPLPSNAVPEDAGAFTSYSVTLPKASMHSSTQFQWRQKTHSSFPIDVASGLTLEELIAAENDPTGVRGEMGETERELWEYRNLFDQWAIDDVRLEVRLNVPEFSLVAGAEVGVGVTEVRVASPVPGSWVEIVVGDGTHAFPTCESPAEGAKPNEVVLSMTSNGYIHAVACLEVDQALISSYPVRSPRFRVQAHAPSITSSVDTTGSTDVWTVELRCTDCEFMRYAVVPLAVVTAEQKETASLFLPSCSYGALVDASSGTVTLVSNAKLRVVACGLDLVASELVESEAFVVHPRAPTFSYVVPATTTTSLLDLTIVPPVDGASGRLGIAYIVGEADEGALVCTSDLLAGEVTLEVNVFDVVHAVACCLDVACADSAMNIWGPVGVQAVAPEFSTACSIITPLTLVVQFTPVTADASVRFQTTRTGETPVTLTCTTGTQYEEPVEVGEGVVSVTAVSCRDGLEASDAVTIPVVLDHCCSGRTAYLHESCAHVLLHQEDFNQCPGDGGEGDVQTSTTWSAVTSQWGGTDINGGVHMDNVHCVTDEGLGKRVLELEAHGDFFPGSQPVGKSLADDGSLRDRTTNDRFLEWALDGVSPLPCRPLERCPARRVGAAVTSALKLNAGVMVLQIKPCAAFGTLTQVWWGSYEALDAAATSEEKEIAFLPLWKSALYQAKTTPSFPFTMTSASASVSDATGYTEVVMQWDASTARANLYVDGQLVQKQMGSAVASGPSAAQSPLSIGVWFPNAVAGEPLFPTCQVHVAEVQVFDMQITGGRWCDYEDVAVNTVPCSDDLQCLDWVRNNCFMAIYEATCVQQRANDSDDERDANGDAAPSASFCQFRLQPTAHTSVSSTSMSSRELGLQWGEDEQLKQGEAA